VRVRVRRAHGASVHPREVVKEALKRNAAVVLFAHPHPSGVACSVSWTVGSRPADDDSTAGSDSLLVDERGEPRIDRNGLRLQTRLLAVMVEFEVHVSAHNQAIG
jgi:hypothetical protein